MHRLNCTGCDAYVYATVAMLEKHGCPVCACGQPFTPERLELALTIGVDHPAAAELEARTYRKVRAQQPHARFNGSQLASTDELQLRALLEISAEQRQTARERRLRAIQPTPDDIPF